MIVRDMSREVNERIAAAQHDRIKRRRATKIKRAGFPPWIAPGQRAAGEKARAIPSAQGVVDEAPADEAGAAGDGDQGARIVLYRIRSRSFCVTRISLW